MCTQKRVWAGVYLLFVAFLIPGCSYKSFHDGLKHSQKRECEKLMEPDRSSCLQNLEYKFEEYQRETGQTQLID